MTRHPSQASASQQEKKKKKERKKSAGPASKGIPQTFKQIQSQFTFTLLFLQRANPQHRCIKSSKQSLLTPLYPSVSIAFSLSKDTNKASQASHQKAAGLRHQQTQKENQNIEKI